MEPSTRSRADEPLWRWFARGAGIVALTAGVGVGAAWWFGRDPVPPTPAYVGRATLDVGSWVVENDRRSRWSLRHPRIWHVQLAEETMCLGDAMLVTNFDADLAHPDLGEGSCTSLWDMRGLRRDAVIVQIATPTEGASDLGLRPPLSLADGLEMGGATRRGVPPGISLPVVLDDGRGFLITFWANPGASRHDLEIAARIVASIRLLA